MRGRIRLTAVGDIWLQTAGGRHPFEEVGRLVRDKDILFGNLETALSETGERAEKHHVIATSPDAARYLADAGFDILSVANNHAGDLGAEGFRNTLDALTSRGILPVGDRREPAVIERNGVSVGFIGYATGRSPRGVSINRLVEEDVVRDVASLAGECDHIAVSLHWGVEMASYPSPAQIDLARRLVDAGATLILGHHAHTIQAIERYHGGLIAYSLGMFQFDPRWPHNVSEEAIMLSVDLCAGGVVGEHRTTPLVVGGDFVPRPAEDERILSFVDDISRPVADGTLTWSRWFEEVAPAYMRMNLESYRYRVRRNGILPLLEMGAWFCTPFCLRCCAGLVRRRFRREPVRRSGQSDGE